MFFKDFCVLVLRMKVASEHGGAERQVSSLYQLVEHPVESITRLCGQARMGLAWILLDKLPDHLYPWWGKWQQEICRRLLGNIEKHMLPVDGTMRSPVD